LDSRNIHGRGWSGRELTTEDAESAEGSEEGRMREPRIPNP